MTRALIAEDEPLLARALQSELATLWPELEVIGVARNGVEALARLQDEAPDVAFLDIRMPGLTGIEVAQSLAEDWDSDRPAPLLVFVTAYDEFAVSAFEQAAVDYLLKPVQTARLATALERVKARLAGRAPDSAAASADALALQLRQLLANAGLTGVALPGHASATTTGGGGAAPGASTTSSEPLRVIRAGVGDTVRMIPIERVILIQAADKYVSVLTADQESLIREPLKDLMPRLDPTRFAQIHRSAVVNMDYVESAVRDDTGKVTLRLRGRPEKPVVSRLYVHLFRPM